MLNRWTAGRAPRGTFFIGAAAIGVLLGATVVALTASVDERPRLPAIEDDPVDRILDFGQPPTSSVYAEEMELESAKALDIPLFVRTPSPEAEMALWYDRLTETILVRYDDGVAVLIRRSTIATSPETLLSDSLKEWEAGEIVKVGDNTAWLVVTGAKDGLFPRHPFLEWVADGIYVTIFGEAKMSGNELIAVAESLQSVA